MFIGEYLHSIDEKGRVIVPAKYRELLKKDFILTRGLDHCLFVYPSTEWEDFQNKLKQLPLTNPHARKLVRFFLSGGVECNTDRQGRILIPMHLRNYASLIKDIVFIGVGNRIELWSNECWNAYNTEEWDMTQMTEQMEALGI